MKSLRLYDKQDLRYEEVDEPVINRSDMVKIQVKSAGICGSDLSRYKKLGPYVSGMVFGHEFSGEVVDIGSDVTNVKVGDRVACSPSLICRHQGKDECQYCKKAEFARCENLTVLGAIYPGGFAEYTVLPAENVVRLTDNVSYEEAAMIEPSSVVLHGLYKLNFKVGNQVVVIGCGNIGLMAIKWLNIMGASKIIAVDINDDALIRAKETGATDTINSMKSKTELEIKELTGGLGADHVVEAAGSPVTSVHAFSYAKKGGEIVYLGIPYSDINFERYYFEKIVRSELTVYGSWNSVSGVYPGNEWTTTVDALSSGLLKLEDLITHRLELSDGEQVFHKMTNRNLSDERFGKVMFSI
ncbi:galactitol-1-phosphate 5-dehydrogenase [Vagococcus luciliae]|uniref:Galactitol 1-phosphate 5-dehydrogenase n=1 Tax=Vagococcus luciliae TaxID=2920380 RepID=A0ABY5NYI9_9ENTE|nr:galactitol-1-phosphate 5-dehydrogenase [Vagococcus luciliae]UUV98587.1 Galactitol 1-phosphate 5-dehydrogenase [Vagococcus luciliae]